jgi:hypothetical protein
LEEEGEGVYYIEERGEKNVRREEKRREVAGKICAVP